MKTDEEISVPELRHFLATEKGLRVSIGTLWRWISYGARKGGRPMPAHTEVGRRTRVVPREVLAWLEEENARIRNKREVAHAAD
jgi:hypothetical protein